MYVCMYVCMYVHVCLCTQIPNLDFQVHIYLCCPPDFKFFPPPPPPPPQELMEGMDSDRGDGGCSGALEKLTTKLTGFISDARNVKSSQFVLSVAALCHMDTDLAYWVWVEMFPKLWGVLSERQRSVRVIVKRSRQ